MILATGWTPIDPILSVLVSLLILRSAWRWSATAATSCSRRRPPDFDAAAIAADLRAAIPGVPRYATCTPGRSPRRARW